MDSPQKQLLIELAAKILQIIDEADEEGNLRQVRYRIESLFANEYSLPPDEIAYQLQAGESEAFGKIAACFVCGTEVPEHTAEKVTLAAGIGGHLCKSCNQIRLTGSSDSREYADLSDEEKNLLKLFQ